MSDTPALHSFMSPEVVLALAERDKLRAINAELVSALCQYGFRYSDEDLQQLATSTSRMGEISPQEAKREIIRRAAIDRAKEAK